jgi:hypothetical protein
MLNVSGRQQTGRTKTIAARLRLIKRQSCEGLPLDQDEGGVWKKGIW